jgi:hypothetical protein
LSACGNVSGAEVRHDVDSGQFCEQCRVVELDRIAMGVELLRSMAHGLAVRADGSDAVCLDRGGALQGLHHLGVGFGEPVGGEGAAMKLVMAGAVQRQELCRKRGIERKVGVLQHLRATVAGEVDQHTVDAVERGARHQSRIELPHRDGPSGLFGGDLPDRRCRCQLQLGETRLTVKRRLASR